MAMKAMLLDDADPPSWSSSPPALPVISGNSSRSNACAADGTGNDGKRQCVVCERLEARSVFRSV
jgi:hypothetical protein